MKSERACGLAEIVLPEIVPENEVLKVFAALLGGDHEIVPE